MKGKLSILLILFSLLIPSAVADPIAPEDIIIELNGERFQYGDTMRIKVYGDNNTTYKFYIEDKSYVLRMHYIPIWCNWSGIGTASRMIIRPDEEPRSDIELRLQPRWHNAYIKLPNVTSGNPMVEFKVELSQEEVLAIVLEGNEDEREMGEEQGFWNDVRIGFLIFILIIVNIAIVWKKIIPHRIRLFDPVYDKKLGQTVRPFQKYTKLERILIFISEKVRWGRTKSKMRRKQSKTTYPRNITSDINPPEKMKQALDSNKHYLKQLESENKAILFTLTGSQAKLEALREAPELERDIQAIHMKENEIAELRLERSRKGTRINDTKKTIKTQEAEVKKLMEEEKKGVFIK